ncbi:hypothetical protein OOZ15_09685 [Galbibacter sp. EGI 63066]|uniref:hypothetical protein n=1 Tax=Galbibacter sp. EGI 63066 TaxID=2993559 RepID=UPI0022487891|nr:hypothetical protein [Galbibacter sp. EGI 63066]MCX2680208.1 hypothetical protein [Galbibacter sp. EGI 63066]
MGQSDGFGYGFVAENIHRTFPAVTPKIAKMWGFSGQDTSYNVSRYVHQRI